MQQITDQLKTVRRTGRLLLLLRRVAQWLSVLVPLMIALGLLDYGLRLPGVMRLLIGLAVVAVAGVWLVTRLRRAVQFWSTLAELALRVERLYPQLAGSLASAVEFSLQPAGYSANTSTDRMTQLAIEEMQDKSQGVDVKRLINPKPTLQACAVALLTICILGAIAASTPQASATAASRWLLPLGDAQWPKVNAIEVLTRDDSVFAADGKIRLRASVVRGWADGLRMTIQYRVPDSVGNGDWQSVRIAEQRQTSATHEHLYEAVLDVPPAVARSLMAGQRPSALLEVRYIAGDAMTPIQELTLAARPEVQSVVVTTTPPDYALGILGEQRTPLHEQTDRIASTTAYIGSKAALDVQFNKLIPSDQAINAAEPWMMSLPGDAEFELDEEDDQAKGFSICWVIKETVTGSFVLSDGFGLASSQDDRQYRIKAVEDELPSVMLNEPSVDESVLPGAVASLRASAEDDIAMRLLQLEVLVPDRANTPEDADGPVTKPIEDGALYKTGRFESLELDYTLNLAPLALLPGDEVLITAIGGDIYELDGEQHELVRSETRRLRIITERELADQVRRALRGVRNSAQSLERNQRIVSRRTQEGQPGENAEQQGDLSRRIAAQEETIDTLRQRLERNSPEDLGVLEDLLERTAGLLDQAAKASQQAEQSLGEAAKQQQAAQAQAQAAAQAEDRDKQEQAQRAAAQAQTNQQEATAKASEAQEQAGEQLAELIAALDMGESVGEIESELSSIKSDAERVARETRELLPKTIGKTAEELEEPERTQLQENAAKQRELAERAEELINKIRATADEIGENGQTPEQRATAKTLSEAADIAERQGLEQNTEEAADQLEQNQIADAASQQQQTMATLEQMLQELGKQQDRRQEELKRLLQELAQKIEQLTAEQRDQVARAEEADGGALGLLEQPQFALRRRTMLVEAQAMEAPDTAEVGNLLGEAVIDQGEAVKAIRVQDKEGTVRAEAQALAHLEAALALINDRQDEEQEEQVRQERFALRQAYYDLADRQQQLITTVTQHEREEAYGRRDWRQINRLYREMLDDRTFDEEQAAIGEAAQALSEKAGEAMVYQSLHRRMDQASKRAENRLSERSIDGLVIGEQMSVARMLRAMGDALDDTADPEKFENDREEQEGGQDEGEGQGENEPPPLVPDLAEIKLLREIMIVLRDETQLIAEAGDDLTPQQRENKLNELAEQQRELKALGEQLIEKLQQ